MRSDKETSVPTSETRRARDEKRTRLIEDAIYKRARGYKQSVKKTFKVKQVEYDPTTGKKTAEREELKTGIDEVSVPADVRAGIYWLSNRAPERWGAHASGAERMSDGEIGGVVVLPEIEELPDGTLSDAFLSEDMSHE